MANFFRNPAAAVRFTLAAVAAVALTVLAWQGVSTALADHNMDLAQGNDRDNPGLVAREIHNAIRFRPDLAEAWRLDATREALTNPTQARLAAQHAVALAPNDWENWSNLGLIEFQLGNPAASRHDVARAAQLNHGFEGHYQLGNLELAEGDAPAYWREMAKALQFATPDQADLILNRATALAASEPHLILDFLPGSRPEIVAEAIRLLAGQHLDAAISAWSRLRCAAYQRTICGATAVMLVNRIAVDIYTSAPGTNRTAQLASAIKIWNDAVGHGDLAQDEIRPGWLADTDFLRLWQGPAFSWIGTQFVPTVIDAPDAPTPGTRAVRFEFTGDQGDAGQMMQQFVPVTGGDCYRVSLLSRRLGSSTEGGVMLAVSSHAGHDLTRLDLQLDSQWHSNQTDFCVPPTASLIAVTVGYERPNGEVRLNNSVLIAAPKLRLLPRPGSQIIPGEGALQPSATRKVRNAIRG